MVNSNPQAKISSMVNGPLPATSEGVNKTTTNKTDLGTPKASLPKGPVPEGESYLDRKWREAKEWAKSEAMSYAAQKMDVGTKGPNDGLPKTDKTPGAPAIQQPGYVAKEPHASTPKIPNAKGPMVQSQNFKAPKNIKVPKFRK